MDLKAIAVSILLTSVVLSIVLYIVMKIISRRSERDGSQEHYKSYEMLTGNKKSNRKQMIHRFMQDSYIAYNKVPFLRNYIQKIRKRLQAIHSYDEFTMRRETMRIVFYTLGTIAAVVLVLLLMNHDFTFIFMLFLAAIVVNGMLIDTFVHKVDDRLLIQLRDQLFKDVRHHYHQHGSVEEALRQASESSSYEAALHAKKIHEVLVSVNPEESLTVYYEQAPNRFLKAFAGMSFLIKEFGDKTIKDGSLYLSNLNKLASEVNLEILKRTRLNYLFKGLTVIAVTPIIFTKPIELWASQQFPAMEAFYSSKLGFITKIVVFASVLLSYILLKKMQDQQEGTYVAKTKKRSWEKLLLKSKIVSWIVDRLEPAKRTAQHFKISKLIKDANAGYPMEWHYLHRFVLTIILSIGLVFSFVLMHHIAIKDVLESPTQNNSMFGRMSEEELREAKSITDFDSTIIKHMKEVKDNNLQDRVVQMIKQDPEVATNDTLLNASTERILAKMDRINSEYMKWWEILICLLMGWVGYQLPYWVLLFQKRMRAMDMQNEVDQFHTIIAMLSEIDRVSVEVILEWMERFASIFKAPLHKCLMNYESGAELALEQLMIDAPFAPLVRTIEKLQLAVEKIPVKQAFDDLETERNYYFEQRKQDYEEMINAKAGWGRMIGFTPMYMIIFLYLVFPFVFMAFTQMSTYYELMQKL
ncbi:hypothetical protein CXK86_19965 [Paenibacillus sp. BGI2013]|uniref:Type II secretion system protein GspF domain-containing protein n=1 Tax=Paenibacillus amylolyticus TaxID=1451 RepID=A0ABD8B287_PAEAM|nr:MULTISPECIES: hypothetical protein [unclassified Paenibacillus]PJN64591.1 hypothetical protein PAEAM_06770 [Paenibacillus sp. GM1FR]PKQ89330.1 hypothetical protein CXK86_19965 [Paenibacillus sp. BGI2013]